jgi:hypothetical protein
MTWIVKLEPFWLQGSTSKRPAGLEVTGKMFRYEGPVKARPFRTSLRIDGKTAGYTYRPMHDDGKFFGEVGGYFAVVRRSTPAEGNEE